MIDEARAKVAQAAALAEASADPGAGAAALAGEAVVECLALVSLQLEQIGSLLAAIHAEIRDGITNV